MMEQLKQLCERYGYQYIVMHGVDIPDNTAFLHKDLKVLFASEYLSETTIQTIIGMLEGGASE